MWSKVSRSKFVMCKLRERSSCCSVNCYSFSILSSWESWEEHNTRQVRKTRTCQCLLNLSSKQKQHKKSIEETKGDYDDVGREGDVSFNLQIMHVLQKVYDISNTLSFSRALSITPNRCLSLLCSIRGKLPKLHVVLGKHTMSLLLLIQNFYLIFIRDYGCSCGTPWEIFMNFSSLEFRLQTLSFPLL